MAVAFIGLLCIQIFYMKNIVQIRYEQFSQGVRQSLVAVAQHLEQDEARHFLEEDVNSIRSSSIFAQYLGDNNVPNLSGVKYSFTTSTGLEADLTIKGDVHEISKLQTGARTIRDHYQNLQDTYHDRYLYQKGMIDDVILNIVSSASNRPIAERADSATLASYLRQELDTLGLRMPFEFAVANYAGTVLYKSAGFQAQAADRDNMFVQALFPNDNTGRLNYLKVYFPTKKDYIFSSISFMVPAFAFTFILLIIFVFTIIVAFRQKKLTEMKNDFINNMTHEFKTPVATISLAAQMLSDPSVEKKPDTVTHLSTVIADETKRLRFQVEKVLQMSILDRKAATYRKRELDIDRLAAEVASTFRLRVENVGGEITTNLDAEDMMVYADEMHLSGVLFNLLDNALKYRDPERAPHLEIATHVEGSKAVITVSDNGIGIKKENLKKIFDKFYRVHTGNLHDVKGFGLGLAYVKRVVTAHGGNITAESKAGQGTSFIITLPTTKK